MTYVSKFIRQMQLIFEQKTAAKSVQLTENFIENRIFLTCFRFSA